MLHVKTAFYTNTALYCIVQYFGHNYYSSLLQKSYSSASHIAGVMKATRLSNMAENLGYNSRSSTSAPVHSFAITVHAILLVSGRAIEQVNFYTVE